MKDDNPLAVPLSWVAFFLVSFLIRAFVVAWLLAVAVVAVAGLACWAVATRRGRRVWVDRLSDAAPLPSGERPRPARDTAAGVLDEGEDAEWFAEPDGSVRDTQGRRVIG